MSSSPSPSPSLVRTILTDPAHLLSVVRIPMAAIIWWRPGDATFVAIVLILAALSDIADGRLGRAIHAPMAGTKNIGAWLDPICDKIFITSAAAAIIVTHHTPWFVLALLLIRDASMLVLTGVFRVFAGPQVFHGHDFRARWSGKLTTGAQLFVLLAIIWWPAAVVPLAWLSGALGIVAVVERVVLAWRDRARALSTD